MSVEFGGMGSMVVTDVYKRQAVHGVDGVHPHAALETCRSDLAQQALHLDLVDQVLGGLVDVGEPVDRCV